MRHIEPIDLPEPRNFVEAFGRKIRESANSVGFAICILVEAIFCSLRLSRRRAEFGRQLMNCSIKSLFIVSIVAFFIGMIISLQLGKELATFNQEAHVGSAVLEMMIREMGPFMTALIMASSIGASYSAELGTMTVSEEISALKIMNINPIEFLISPRLVAMAIMCPALTIYTNILGTVGGMIVAKTQLGVSYQSYFDNAIAFSSTGEVLKGLFKSFIFAIIIVTVSSYQGFMTRNGAVGVGVATRKTVVTSFIYILMFGYIITRILY